MITPLHRRVVAALFLVVFILLSTHAALTQLTVRVETVNAGPEIRDASAHAVIEGGTAPYTFKWSKRDTPQSADTCSGMDEGIDYTLAVTDSGGATAQATFRVPPTSTEEKLNAFFVPLVNALAAVLLWDPFAAIGIYDPVVYNADGTPLLHPNGDPVTQDAWLIVVLLIGAALYLTFYMRFINVRAFRHAIALMAGRYARKGDKGEVSQFQALTAALSGTVGMGNIALVAVAISVGGPGATFWMVVAGLIGMSSKFTECTLGVKYRHISETGEVSGGPMYYLSKGLAMRKKKTLGRILAVLFAVMCVGGSLGGGNMVQANQLYAQVQQVAGGGIPTFWFGIVLAALVGLVIVGGIKSIARVSDKLIPFAVVVYVGFALIIIGVNVHRIGEAFMLIIRGAFEPDAAVGGFAGVMLMGFRRAMFSNEAGIGSASIAHSASRTNRPVSEGIVALLEPFIDTVVVCTMTALVLIFTGYASNAQGLTGSTLTNAAFTSVFPWFDKVLLLCILLFAYTTMITWSYYGMKSWAYLFGEKWWVKQSFNGLFLMCTVLGTVAGLGAVLDFSDMMILGMAFPNLIGLFMMRKEVRADMRQYMNDLKQGLIKRHH